MTKKGKKFPNRKSSKPLSRSHRDKIGYFMMGNKRGMKNRFKEGHELNTGDKNPNWQGGISNSPYGKKFNKKLKSKIKIRDNNECILCRLKLEREKEELSSQIYWVRTLLITKMEANMNRRLSIHHIDYDKKNNKKDNLITLCSSHHIETNYKRDHWKKFLQSLLREKYDYQYQMEEVTIKSQRKISIKDS